MLCLLVNGLAAYSAWLKSLGTVSITERWLWALALSRQRVQDVASTGGAAGE